VDRSSEQNQTCWTGKWEPPPTAGILRTQARPILLAHVLNNAGSRCVGAPFPATGSTQMKKKGRREKRQPAPPNRHTGGGSCTGTSITGSPPRTAHQKPDSAPKGGDKRPVKVKKIQTCNATTSKPLEKAPAVSNQPARLWNDKILRVQYDKKPNHVNDDKNTTPLSDAQAKDFFRPKRSGRQEKVNSRCHVGT